MLTAWAPALPRAWSRPARHRPTPSHLAAAAALVVALAGAVPIELPSRASAPGAPVAGGADAQALGRLPVRFEANLGQTDGRARFMARAAGTSLFLTRDALVLSVPPGAAGAAGAATGPGAVRLGLVGADPEAVEGEGVLPGLSNYYLGSDPAKWVRSVPAYAEVRYRRLLPGIDLVVHARSGDLEYDYELAPGADPSDIAIDVSGAETIRLDEVGDLVLDVPGGQIRQKRPVAFQDTGGARKAVDAAFVVEGQRVRFDIGAFDPTQPLVIDPTLAYSTLLGGSGDDEAHAVALDGADNAFVTGRTTSPDFPVTGQGPNTDGASVAFVTKLNPTGTELVYSSYFGGTGGDDGLAIALRAGQAYVTGRTGSEDFPTTTDAFRRQCGTEGTCGGGTDAFLAAFAPDGTLSYSTYLGGRSEDAANAVSVDPSGRVHLAGSTFSTHFPTTAGSLMPVCGADGGCDANATFIDGESTAGSATFTSASANFTGDDEGKEITGENLAAGTTIAVVVDATTVTLSQPATATGTSLSFSIANTSFDDGAATLGSTTYTSVLPHFLPADAGKGITGAYIPGDTTIASVVDATTVVLSAAAEGTGSGLPFTIDRHTFTDGASVIGTPNYTSVSAAFTDADRGRPFRGQNIPADTVISSVVDATTVTLSNGPTASGTNLTFGVDRDMYVGASFIFNGSSTFNSRVPAFEPGDVGKRLVSPGLAPGTTIAALISTTRVGISQPAIADDIGRTFRVERSTFHDGASTSGGTTFTSATAAFEAGDVGDVISGDNIDAGTTISAVIDATSVTLSSAATGTGTGLTFTVDRDSTFHDGAATTDSPPFTSATASFQPTDEGRTISGTNIPSDTTIQAVLSATSVQLSQNATGTGSNLRFTIDRGRRRENPNRFAFLSVLDPSVAGAGGLVYSTYLGGRGETSADGITLDGAEAIVVGSTRAPDLPTAAALQGTWAGEQDAFVARIDPGGAGPADLLYSTFLGGGGNDGASAVAIDGGGIHLTGFTTSGDFPLQNAFDGTLCENCDRNAFVTKLDPSGSSLVFSTYLGGASGAFDLGRAIAVGPDGAVSVAGVTSSPDFPTKDPLMFRRGEWDGFVTMFQPDGTGLIFSTYLGGGSFDEANGIALDSTGQAVVAGKTSPGATAADSVFPTTAGAFRVCGSGGACDPGGPSDAFVTRFAPGVPPALASVSPRGGPVTVATPVQITGSGFTGASAVRFGAVPVAFTVLSDGAISATSPAVETPGLVPVTVTNADGTSLTTTLAMFRYGEGLFTPTAPCLVDSCAQGATLLPSGKVLVLHGEGDREAGLYDPATGTWSATGSCANLPGPDGPQGCSRGFPSFSMTVLAGPPASCGTNCGKVLVSGGYPPGSAASNLKAAFLYDPATGTWRRTADMNVRRVNHSSTLLPDGRVLVAGGCVLRFRGCGPSGGAPEVTAEIYHPDTETWTMTTSMGAGRAVHPAVLLDPAVSPCGSLCGKVLAIGGVASGAQIDAVEAYDPATATWTVQAPLGLQRYAEPALQVPGGSVVVIGGYNNQRTTSEYLDLAGGGWSDTGPMAWNSDNEGKAVRLANGKVLSVAGGREAQLYDGPSHTFAATGPRINEFSTMSVVRLSPGPASACGANCGKVLIVGNSESSTGFVPAAELYTPRPTVTGLSAATGPLGGGVTITITGTGLTTVSSVRFGDVNATNLFRSADSPDTTLTVVAPAHAAGAVDVTVFGPAGRSPVTPAGVFTYTSATGTTTTTTTTTTTATAQPTVTPPTIPGSGAAAGAGGLGYSLAAADGGVFNFGTAPFAGSLGGIRLTQPIVGMERTPSGRGYWLVGADGGVFAFGDAVFRGSTGGIRLARPIVGMRSTPSGNGYWLVASDGGVFAFGDAVFRGSTGALRLAQPVVGLERSASGNGYWLVASDGGVFAFGDAVFRGSTGGLRLAQPVVAITRSGGGGGYLLVASDGGVFAFGDAVFRGSTGGLRLNSPIVGMAPSPGGNGYWLCARDGGVFAFGSAPFLGSMGAARLNQPMVGCA